jgi:hypothetical protein
MRLALAAFVTTILPTVIGSRWLAGPASVRYGLGTLVGVALVSLGVITGGLTDAIVPAVSIIAAAGWLLGPRFRVSVQRSTPADSATTNALFFIGAVGCCLMALAVFRPIPEWDGWMNWSIKAKALALDGNFRGPVFTSSVFVYSHQDYPPLFSAWQALSYIISGDFTVSWPLQFQLAWLWTTAAIGLVSAVSSQWGKGSLFIMAWVCSPQVIFWVMAGYADVPLAFFLLGGVVLLLLPSPQPAVVAGLLLGACALTKNEGLPLALAAVLTISWFSVAPRISLAALGILVGIWIPWFLFTYGMGLSNDVINAEDLRPARVIGLLPRTITIAEAWVSELFTFRRWGFLAIAACLAFVLRWKPRRDLVVAILASIVLLTFVYVVTPRNLVRQLGNSLGRVAIAPMGLLALSMATARIAPPGAETFPVATFAARGS